MIAVKIDAKFKGNWLVILESKMAELKRNKISKQPDRADTM